MGVRGRFITITGLGSLDVLTKKCCASANDGGCAVGEFLTDGIDSSTVVVLMQVQSSCIVKTFTIGFNEKTTARQYTRKL